MLQNSFIVPTNQGRSHLRPSLFRIFIAKLIIFESQLKILVVDGKLRTEILHQLKSLFLFGVGAAFTKVLLHELRVIKEENLTKFVCSLQSYGVSLADNKLCEVLNHIVF